MSAGPAAALGIGLRVLAHSWADPAAQVVRDVHIGSHDDLGALKNFAHGCRVVTFDHEHVPPSYLEQLEAMGVAVRPGPTALFHAQDKIHLRQALTNVGIPGPRWTVIDSVAMVADFAVEVGWPVVLKMSRGGYDGRGVWVVNSGEEAASVLSSPLPTPSRWLAEEHIGDRKDVRGACCRWRSTFQRSSTCRRYE